MATDGGALPVLEPSTRRAGSSTGGTGEVNCWNRLLDLLKERIQDLAAMVVEVFFAATRELICWNRLLDLLDPAKSLL